MYVFVPFAIAVEISICIKAQNNESESLVSVPPHALRSATIN